MNKPLRIFLHGSVLGALLTLAVPSVAMGPGGDRGFSPSHRLEHLDERLDLSDSQRSEIEALMQAGEEQREADREKLATLRSSLEPQVADFDAGATQQIADEIGALTASMTYRHTELKASIYDLLDETQQAEMAALQEEREGRGGKKKNRHKNQD